MLKRHVEYLLQPGGRIVTLISEMILAEPTQKDQMDPRNRGVDRGLRPSHRDRGPGVADARNTCRGAGAAYSGE